MSLAIDVAEPLSALETGVESAILGSISLGLVNGLVTALVNGTSDLVADAIESVIGGFRALGTGVTTGLVDPILTAVTTVHSALFLDDIVAVTVNAQNHPSTGGTPPPEWASLPPGRFDVSALRVAILDGLGNLSLYLHFGRGSVGPSCLLADQSPRCVT